MCYHRKYIRQKYTIKAIESSIIIIILQFFNEKTDLPRIKKIITFLSNLQFPYIIA